MAAFAQFRDHIGVLAALPFVIVGAAGCGSSSGARTAAYGTTASPSPTAQRTIKVPDSFAGYTRLTSADAQRVIQDIRKAQAQQNPVFAAKMKIAVFQRHGDAHQRIAF